MLRPIRSPRVASSRARLALQPLEGRLTPAGTITASLSAGGVLSLIGDDQANNVTVQIVGSDVTLTPDGTTTISPTNVLHGTVKSIKVDLKGGDDVLAIDGALPLSLSGTASFAMGDGNNTLTLDTTGVITLKGLTVTGGDGSDTVTVHGAAGSTIGGTAKFTYANGGSTTTLDTLSFTSVNISAGDAVTTPNEIDATNVKVAKSFSAVVGNSNPGLVSFDTCVLGSLKETGYVGAAILTDTNVNGTTKIQSGIESTLSLDGATLTGAVTVKAAQVFLDVSGAPSIFGGALSVTGSVSTTSSFATSDVTEVKGKITVKGGWYNDSFITDSNFQADKDVSLNLGDGDNVITLGDGAAAIPLMGKLQIQTGAGNDLITLDQVAVAGTVDLKAGGGADLLSIEDGASFAKTFKADMGAGDDTISIAQNVGTPGPVTFTGKATIKAGAGNDGLFLGIDPALGGDATSATVFTDSTSSIDGGTGFDFYEPADGNTTSVITTNWE